MNRADVCSPCTEGYSPLVIPGASSWTPTEQGPLAEGLPYAREFSYQGLRVWPNVYLAPMEGVTDPAFRRLCKRLAGGRMGMLVSEFVSIEGLTRFNPKTEEKARFFPEELPFTVQIFGAEPERMAWAAKRVEESGASAVEINCGCPVPKVVKKGGGSGLLRDLPLLAKICTEVRSAVSIPCSIKVRIGWADDFITAFETLKIAEDTGMGLLVVHGRTRSQGYKGWANWDVIGEVKSRAKIPVVGNGDITTWQGAVDRLSRYGVDGVLCGRGAMHNPWIFGQIADLYEGRVPRSPTLQEHQAVFRMYLDLLREEMDHDGRVLGKLKQFAARCMKSLRGVSTARTEMLRSESVQHYLDISDAFFERLEQEGGASWDPGAVRELNGKNAEEPEAGASHW
ncbi:MAG: tRNA-dihydrouridine synthase [Fibrobacterota bacterium]|nr:tRNA-dihydrouridine synthase [Fibrobacterota bacterium]QQS04160.1 MAG: tRNA-dihydrouridine synthase [Fibrobacterota bacterium]